MNIPKRELPDYKLISDLIIDENIPEIRTVEDAHRTVYDIIQAMDKKEPFFTRVKAFISGENKLGRGIGRILDFATIFVPYGSKVNSARDAIDIILQRKTKRQNMSVLKDKAWYQSKTLWSAVIIMITGIIQALGMDLAANPETTETVYQIIYTVSGAFGLYGLRDAIGTKLPEKGTPESERNLTGPKVKDKG